MTDSSNLDNTTTVCKVAYKTQKRIRNSYVFDTLLTLNNPSNSDIVTYITYMKKEESILFPFLKATMLSLISVIALVNFFP